MYLVGLHIYIKHLTAFNKTGRLKHSYRQQLNVISMKQQNFADCETCCKAKKDRQLQNNYEVLRTTRIFLTEQFTLEKLWKTPQQIRKWESFIRQLGGQQQMMCYWRNRLLPLSSYYSRSNRRTQQSNVTFFFFSVFYLPTEVEPSTEMCALAQSRLQNSQIRVRSFNAVLAHTFNILTQSHV